MARADDSSSSTLTVDFSGEVHTLTTTDQRDGSWWLHNVGRRLSLTILDGASRSSATLTSGREISLSFDSAVIAFEAGATSYELDVTISDPQEAPAVHLLIDDDTGTGRKYGTSGGVFFPDLPYQVRPGIIVGG